MQYLTARLFLSVKELQEMSMFIAQFDLLK